MMSKNICFFTGLSLFVNDIPVLRTFLWSDVVEPEFQTNPNFNPFPSVTIGKRNDYLGGFSVFEIGEIHFWEGVVDGTPFLHLG